MVNFEFKSYFLFSILARKQPLKLKNFKNLFFLNALYKSKYSSQSNQIQVRCISNFFYLFRIITF